MTVTRRVSRSPLRLRKSKRRWFLIKMSRRRKTRSSSSNQFSLLKPLLSVGTLPSTETLMSRWRTQLASSLMKAKARSVSRGTCSKRSMIK